MPMSRETRKRNKHRERMQGKRAAREEERQTRYWWEGLRLLAEHLTRRGVTLPGLEGLTPRAAGRHPRGGLAAGG